MAKSKEINVNENNVELENKIENAVFELTFNHRVSQAQLEISVPKIQGNSYLNYKYRSCEQILEAVKPVLKKYNLLLILNDEIVEIAGRFYVKSVAKIMDTQSDKHIESVAYAREDEAMLNPKSNKAMMASPQLTGSSSSYARKYALSGLFLLDDNKDADKIADDETNKDTGELAKDSDVEFITNNLSTDRLEKALAFVKCNDLMNLTAYQAEKIISLINKQNKSA